MGTGPYRFTGFRPAESITVERYAGYWGEKPAVQQAQINCIVDEATRFLAMRTGKIDGTFTSTTRPGRAMAGLAGVSSGIRSRACHLHDHARYHRRAL